MSIDIREMDRSCFELYDKVPMNVEIHSVYTAERAEGGLGGIIFEEKPTEPAVKDLSRYERAVDYEKQFDISNWRFYMAFDGERPVGAMTVAGTTEGLNMLYGRTDACVLWDIRVDDSYKHRGIGKRLMELGIENARSDGYRQMIIECQNNNVTACKFYRRMGAVLSKIDMYAYYLDPEIRDEIMLIWYLDL